MEKTTDYMAYDVDYSSDPTVDVCLNCTAETCPGTCIRAARIAAGLGDPGPEYDGKRYLRKGYTAATLRRIADEYGVTVDVVDKAKFYCLDEADLRACLERQYGRYDAAARSAAALDRHDRRRMVERLVDVTGTSVTTINRCLRAGMTCDEIRAHYAANPPRRNKKQAA